MVQITYVTDHDRTHSVKLDGVISPPLPVISGVPQGSILGLLLFFICLVAESISDAAVHFSVIWIYCLIGVENGDLSFNHSKCVHMHFSQILCSKSSLFYLDGTPIQTVILHCDLVIILSSDLKWTAHSS